jgi:hypothetical protein
LYLIQVLIPVRHKNGSRVPADEFVRLRRLLVETFGGLTEFSRSPARGLWKPDPKDVAEKDDIVVFEVMTETLDRTWWALIRQALEARLGQEMIVIRSQAIELL